MDGEAFPVFGMVGGKEVSTYGLKTKGRHGCESYLLLL